jgi:limonene-1,2-epoxide hydrolase
MSTNEKPIDVVRRFCDAWSNFDIDALCAFFTPDAVYHNIPVDPVSGVDAIRATIAGFTTGIDKVEFQLRNIVADGNVVLTERVDVFVAGAKRIELPVMGTFEIEGGAISAWRDYFDLNQFMSQLTA